MDCNHNCTNEQEKPKEIPYIVYESERARSDRLFKRMWVALIVAVALLFTSNAIWLWAWTSYDYYSEYVTVDSADGGNANYIGQDGDIYNGNGYSEETVSTEKAVNPNNQEN